MIARGARGVECGEHLHMDSAVRLFFLGPCYRILNEAILEDRIVGENRVDPNEAGCKEQSVEEVFPPEQPDDGPLQVHVGSRVSEEGFLNELKVAGLRASGIHGLAEVGQG